MNAEAEDHYWSTLDDKRAFIETAGVPPYDVYAVGSLIVGRCVAHPARVLDLGCGQGRLTNDIARFLPEWTVHGVDISRPLLNRAVISGEILHLDNVHYWHGNGRTLPSSLGGRNYDLVYAITVFQHVDPEAWWPYFREIESRLRPGGVFVFTIAVGDADEFLNHQIPEHQLSQFGWDLATLFDQVSIDPDNDERGWRWVTCRKDNA